MIFIVDLMSLITLHHAVLSSDGTISHLADQYLQARSWGIPAALVMMVSVGAARGHKDMIAPLFGSVAYGFFLAIFDILFVFGADLGVSGAGYAASISQWIGGCTVMYMLYRDQKINISDLFSAPKLSDAKPYIAMAPSLALGNAAALAPVLASSSIATTLGPDQLAAHTILRQISTFWIQLFMAYNASAHSLVASSLSTKTPQGLSSAAEIMERICHLALFTTLPLSLSLYIFRAYLPMVFTDNAIVIQDVIGVLPILLVLMPFDALNVSLEGGILGAADTKWIASRSAAGSILSLAALGLLTDETSSLSTVWICLKLLNVSVLALDLTRFLGFLPFGYTSEAQKFD
jgi:putative MATE family efflux protein